MPTGRTEGRAARRRAARVLTTTALAVAALGLGTVPGLAAPGAATALMVPREEADPGLPDEVPELPDGADVPEIPDAADDVLDEEDPGAVLGEEEPAAVLGEEEPFQDGTGPAGRGADRGGEPSGDRGGELSGGGGGGAGKATAEVSPAAVRPGAHLTVAVSCPSGGPAPAALDATSRAFEKGTVKLHKVAGHESSGHEGAGHGGKTAGPAYRGTARIAPAGHLGVRTVDGTCPAAHGKGHPWSAKFTVSKTAEAGGGKQPCPEPAHPGAPCATRPPCPEAVPHGGSCGDGTVPNGVHAGTGGTFTDSVPALVAGGVLIAGACAAAAHRLRPRRRRTTGDG
ncbi:hypothetical protein AB0G32_26005 [Streptomyces sp. NPDC023723]|uniref:hypothetical protein n=1 Tax=Streptomyces sp. NPDC023723 TaxID=3154323 RepID=UPI00340E2336